jgi:hypothetical protein
VLSARPGMGHNLGMPRRPPTRAPLAAFEGGHGTMTAGKGGGVWGGTAGEVGTDMLKTIALSFPPHAQNDHAGGLKVHQQTCELFLNR